MKVIKKGNPKKDTIMTGECRDCECIIECKRHEAKYTADQRDGDFYTVECPTEGCGQLIYVVEKKCGRSSCTDWRDGH